MHGLFHQAEITSANIIFGSVFFQWHTHIVCILILICMYMYAYTITIYYKFAVIFFMEFYILLFSLNGTLNIFLCHYVFFENMIFQGYLIFEFMGIT